MSFIHIYVGLYSEGEACLNISVTYVFTPHLFISSKGVIHVFSPDRLSRQRGPARVSTAHKCPAN